MVKDELTIYEKIEKQLFKSEDDASVFLTETQLNIKNRLMLCVSILMTDPLKSDTELVNFLTGGCGGIVTRVTDSQAYRDVAAIKKMVGNIPMASKTWYRYMIVEGAKKGYEIAVAEKDAKGIAACLDKIGKYTRADKEDDAFDWAQMIPPNMEPTDDVSVLEGFEPIANLEEERKAFKLLFKKEMNKKAVDIAIDE